MANRRIVLAARPEGVPKHSDFKIEEAPVPEASEGQLVVKGEFPSVDPYMRGRMTE